MFRKCMTLGIILLFVGTCIIPSGFATEKRYIESVTSIQFIINDDGDGDPTDKIVDTPPYAPNSGITPTLQINFTITGTNTTETTAFYGDDPWEDWKNITITGDILYPVNGISLYHVGTKGDWNCHITPIRPYGIIDLSIDWPGNGSANNSIQILNGTYITPKVESFPWGLDYMLTISLRDMDGAPLKVAKVCLIWEEDDYEFNQTQGNNKPGNGRNGEYSFWIRQSDQGNLPPKNITIAAEWYPGVNIWGYAKVMMEKPLHPPVVYIDDDYNSSTVGWGYNHFNTIQDGINAVDMNGMVIVSDGTYIGHLIINKSLNLLGEDKYTTIIDANLSGNCIDIFSDNATVRGFTVRNAGIPYGMGIAIYSHNTTICDNIVTNNDGIDGIGIYLQGSNNNNISYNIISNNGWAGIVGGSSKQIIIGNKIIDNNIGIFLHPGSFIVIKHNNISSNNVYGIQFYYVTNSSIIQNNFFNNKGNAVFIRSILEELRVKLSNELFYKKYHKEIYDPYYTPWKKNIWDENYWSRSRILPKPIFGSIRITGYQVWFNDIPFPIDCVNFDWHPAQEPYDIPGMR